MPQTIRFLEALGANPAPIDYAAAVAALDIDDTQRQALLGRDHATLNDLLGGRREKMFCLILPAEEPAPDSEEQPEEPAEETPPTEQSPT